MKVNYDKIDLYRLSYDQVTNNYEPGTFFQAQDNSILMLAKDCETKLNKLVLLSTNPAIIVPFSGYRYFNKLEFDTMRLMITEADDD